MELPRSSAQCVVAEAHRKNMNALSAEANPFVPDARQDLVPPSR